VQLSWRQFQELDGETLYRLLQLRSDVFVLEQQSLYRDIDGRDQAALHLLCLEEGALTGALRVEAPGNARPEATIGRVVVAPEARGGGLGRKMMVEAMERITLTWGAVPVLLGAQAVQQGFYEGLGFRVCSEPYDDGGIAHIDMRRDLPDQGPVTL